MANTVKETRDTRETTHGSFVHRSRVCGNIRAAMLSECGALEPDQAQALIMIADKASRIVCGKANTHDHWLDIAGYAMLVADRVAQGADNDPA